MAEQNKLVLAVTPENWQEVLSELQDRSAFSDFVWLDCAEVDFPDLGPIAVTMEGGALQDVVTDDARLRGMS
jgi:hypothetical protein